MDFYQVDVFADKAFAGNPLAVFPDAGELAHTQMQTIAREMNLSETTFVTSTSDDSYALRIFTPAAELPFAGHPTLGTAWLLRHLGVVKGDEVFQSSAAGRTPVRVRGDHLWFERSGTAAGDLENTDPRSTPGIAAAVGLQPTDIGLEARELGRPGRLMPALASAGVEVLVVPVQDVAALGRCVPRVDLLAGLPADGAYCFTAVRAGGLRARGLFPELGIPEDPATGSAAAALGIYLADRVGDIDLEIAPGVEIWRPSRLLVRAAGSTVEVGGACRLILRGRLEQLP